MVGRHLWIIFRLFLLYLGSFVVSIGFYVYLMGKFLPRHQVLNFPVVWSVTDSRAFVELKGGQRIGGNFYLDKNNRKGNCDSELQSNVPYDISLILKYPDRREVSDLGNLRISLKMVREDESEAIQVDTIRALRYETGVLRMFREILSVPVMLWRGNDGNERVERISLITRMIDDVKSRGGGVVNRNNFDFSLSTTSSYIVAPPINRFEITIDPMPPLHALNLEILANLSPLQHFLYYWPVTSAVLIIGVGTGSLWLLVTLYGLISLIFIILELREDYFKQIKEVEDTDELEDEDENIKEEGEEGIVNVNVNGEGDGDESVVSIEFPPIDSVATFICDLRQRKLKLQRDEGFPFDSEMDIESEDQIDVESEDQIDQIDQMDQNVPNKEE